MQSIGRPPPGERPRLEVRRGAPAPPPSSQVQTVRRPVPSLPPLSLPGPGRGLRIPLRGDGVAPSRRCGQGDLLRGCRWLCRPPPAPGGPLAAGRGGRRRGGLARTRPDGVGEGAGGTQRRVAPRAKLSSRASPARWRPLPIRTRPQFRRDDPLNLSILLSGGKETNKDSLSSGERRGKSPAPNPRPPSGARELWRTEDRFLSAWAGGLSPSDGGSARGRCEAGVGPRPRRGTVLLGVGLFVNAAQSRW